MHQTFNLILLTAVELRGLRSLLERCFNHNADVGDSSGGADGVAKRQFEPADTESYDVFKILYVTWCHNAVAALSLCLLAQVFFCRVTCACHYLSRGVRAWRFGPLICSFCSTAPAVEQAYHLSVLLIPKFCRISITLDVLMQLDRLVLLVESPIFLRQRLQLMDPHVPKHQLLIKTLYVAFLQLKNVE